MQLRRSRTRRTARNVWPRHTRAVDLRGLSERGLLGQVAQHESRCVKHLDGEVEELGTRTAHAKRPSVLAEAGFVEVGFFLCGGGGPEEAAKGTDEGEVDFGWEVPEGLEMLGLQAVDKVHGGDEPGLGCRAADVYEIRIGRF